MSQTQTTGKMITTKGQGHHHLSDADIAMKENTAAAAAALVDVAASLSNNAKKRQASDSLSSSPPTATSSTTATAASSLLPTNSASRKLWDREQAAPPTDQQGAATSTGRSIKDIYPHAFVAAAVSHNSGTNGNRISAEANHGFTIVAPAPGLASPQQQQLFQQSHADMPAPAPAPPLASREGHWSTHAATTTLGGLTHVHIPAAAHAFIAGGMLQQHHLQHQQQQQQPPTASTSIFMSMSSVGFGVDSTCLPTTRDATEAAIRAVRDAMERSAVRLPTAASLRQNLSLHVKLGVPPSPSTGEPMHVDVHRLAPLLPSVNILPVEVVVGGLLIDHKEIEASSMNNTTGAAASYPDQSHPIVCTVVASVTLQQSAQIAAEAETAKQSAHLQSSTTDPSAEESGGGGPWGHLDQSTITSTTTASYPRQQQQQQQHVHSQAQMSSASHPGPDGALVGTSTLPRSSPSAPSKLPSHVHVHRTNSMEMLAMVSGEIRERHLSSGIGGGGGKNNTVSALSSPQGPTPASTALGIICSSEAAAAETAGYPDNNGGIRSSNSTCSNGSNNANSAYSYKKLAPGMTPKNNKRLFVKHSYRDHSHEEPLPEEQFLVRSQDSPSRTPNAAFPLKLHETLTQIEQDGNGHIIGWLPHGRSFKIHQQQEFVNVILPKYFVMTKKSSFLRQLNLYGFNRISVGPDGGSYYHEKFLRGLKFLCRRMTRQKVNGNGIRAAGNPDEEPLLSRFPTCPPGANSCSSSVSHNENDEGDAGDGDGDNRPYSRLVSGASRPYGQIVIRSLPVPTGEKEAIPVTDENSHDSSGSGGGIKKRGSIRVDTTSGQASFPLKLQRILDKADADGKTDVISWLPHGRAFLVHDVDRFVSEIMSQYFNQTKYSSFQRQLHMYNFQRITFGRDKGAYHHPKFQRGRPDLCLTMVRTRVNGKGCRRPGDPDSEPDFYNESDFEPVPPVARGSVVEIPMEGDAPQGLGMDEESEMQGDSGDEA